MSQNKLITLKEILSHYKSILIAYSGGVDSTFLLKVAQTVLKENIFAVIARSGTYTEEEADSAVKYCKDNGVKYSVIETNEFNDEKFISNPPDRCYYCKKELFTRLNNIAKDEGYDIVADGSNITDSSDYRPGTKAKDELGVISPLQTAGITKDDIRQLSKEMGLPTWDKPALACLASRIPYGTRITIEALKNIEEGETYLRSLGLKQVRVRHHGSLVRIEVDQENLIEIFDNGVADDVYRKFKDLGYIYVTIDIKGYRTGSMNEMLSIEEKVN